MPKNQIFCIVCGKVYDRIVEGTATHCGEHAEQDDGS